MQLYYTPGACSQAVHIALREAGVTFDLEKVDLGTKKTETGADFTQVNPKGYVPALRLDNGEVLTEVGAVLQYVADQKPDSGLAPKAGTMERYRLQEWLTFISSEIHKTFSPLFGPTTPEEYKTSLKEKLGKRFEYLDRHLGKNEYLMDGRFTVADAYAYVTVGWSKPMKVDLGRFTNLQAYLERVGNRPKVQEARKAEGVS